MFERLDSKLYVIVTVDHRNCLFKKKFLCKSSAPAVHGQPCGMDPMFFDVCERVVALKHFPGVIMNVYLIRLSKTLARLVTQGGKVQITILKPPPCSDDRKQRAHQAFCAFMEQQGCTQLAKGGSSSLSLRTARSPSCISVRKVFAFLRTWKVSFT